MGVTSRGLSKSNHELLRRFSGGGCWSAEACDVRQFPCQTGESCYWLLAPPVNPAQWHQGAPVQSIQAPPGISSR